MLSYAVRACAVMLASVAIAFGMFAWRWPARWRLPVRPGGDVNQPIPSRYETGDERRGTLALWLIGAVVAVVALAILFAVVV